MLSQKDYCQSSCGYYATSGDIQGRRTYDADYFYNPLSIDMQEAVLSKEELLNLTPNSCSKQHQWRKSFRRRVTSYCFARGTELRGVQWSVSLCEDTVIFSHVGSPYFRSPILLQV